MPMSQRRGHAITEVVDVGVQLIKIFCYVYQHNDINNEDYKEQFESLWAIIKQQGELLTNHPRLIADRTAALAAVDNLQG